MAKVSVTSEEFAQAKVLLERINQFRALSSIREQYARGSITLQVDGNSGRASYGVNDTSPPVGQAKSFNDRVNQQIDEILSAHMLNGIKMVIQVLENQMPFEVIAAN